MLSIEVVLELRFNVHVCVFEERIVSPGRIPIAAGFFEFSLKELSFLRQIIL